MSHPLSARWNELDRDLILKYQDEKLSHYLQKTVLPFSKHYQEVFKKEGIDVRDIRSRADLRQLPFTSKKDLLPTPDQPRKTLDFCLMPDPDVLRKRPSTILYALTHGKKSAQDKLSREFRPSFMTSTTGRSTDPVPFLYSDYDIRNLKLAGSRIMAAGDCTPDERLLNMFPYAPHLAYWLVYHAARETNHFCVGTGGGKVMGTTGNIGLIQKLRPSILVGMPTFCYHVLQMAVEEKRQLEGIRLIVLGGEKVTTGTRRKLIQLCEELGSPGVKVASTYGFTECKMAFLDSPATESSQASGYHLFPDLAHIEVIDPKTGESVPDGTGGEIVYTPLDARGTVVLRYRTGDYIEHGIKYGECPVTGSKAPRLVGKISRVTDQCALQFQKIKGTIIDFNQLEHLLENIPEIGTYQIELRKKNDDPLGLDELNIHLSKDAPIEDSALSHKIMEEFVTNLEVKPNHIFYHDAAAMRELQQVGVAMKEVKFVDNRPSVKTEAA